MKGLTPEGRNWLTLALDPFHDTELTASGWPDMDTTNVVVQVIKNNVTIRKPVGLAPGSTWDAHVVLNPFVASNSSSRDVFGYKRATGEFLGLFPIGAAANSANYTQHEMYCNAFANVTAPRLEADLASVVAYPSGQTVYPDGVHAVNTVGTQFYLPTASTAVAGRRRLVGFGCEVHDTTAELYKQGTVTSYLIPQSASVDLAKAGDLYATNAGQTTITNGLVTANVFNSNSVPEEPYYVLNSPPPNPAAALAYEGTRQWEAKDGCYLTARFHSQNPLVQNSFGRVAFVTGDVDTKMSYSNGIPVAEDSMAHRSEVVTTNFSQSWQAGQRDTSKGFIITPTHMSGAIFTGLNEVASLNVTFKAIWEVAPSVYDKTTSALVYCTHPSPPHDPLALKLYQETVTKLPVAVPVGMNPDGEFWSTCVRYLRSAAGTIGPMLIGSGNPYAAAAGTAMTALSRLGPAQDNTNFRPFVAKHRTKAAASRPAKSAEPRSLKDARKANKSSKTGKARQRKRA